MSKPRNFSDYFALSMTKFFRLIADTFFAKRYGHRAVVLETVAGVPGMVAGVWMHFKSLRKMKTGWEKPYILQLMTAKSCWSQAIGMARMRLGMWPAKLKES